MRKLERLNLNSEASDAQKPITRVTPPGLSSQSRQRWPPPHDRRRVLKFMSAALAMAGLSGCDSVPEGKLIPGVRASENIIPGLPKSFGDRLLKNETAKLLAHIHLHRRIASVRVPRKCVLQKSAGAPHIQQQPD